jgi:hypothetical protein
MRRRRLSRLFRYIRDSCPDALLSAGVQGGGGMTETCIPGDDDGLAAGLHAELVENRARVREASDREDGVGETDCNLGRGRPRSSSAPVVLDRGGEITTM